ncbi:MAG TPA: RagB/SusD family nutrient uptake outer membrane protein [Gemmatimonadaceae bacterium]
MTTILHRARPALVVALALSAALSLGACGGFDITNTNQPTQTGLENNATRSKLSAAATGIFAGARSDITGFIWQVGSMGREGINLSGNNQPDYQEPYFGPLSSTQFGGSEWAGRYANIRSINVYLDAAPKATDLTPEELAASLGFGKTMEALAFMYVIETRANLGAPVDVDRPVTAPPPPFVSEDSVYGFIIGLLDDAQTSLQTASGTSFPFPVPPGFSGFDQPSTFLLFNRALRAKAEVLRATAGCGQTCFAAALATLPSTFIDMTASALGTGPRFDFSTASGDQSNELAEPLDGTTFFADTFVIVHAQRQSGGALDARLLAKTARATRVPTWSIPAVPLPGALKYVNYFTGGQPDPNAPVPIIRDEELILLRAEAELGTADPGGALTDINFIRTQSGKLPAISAGTWNGMSDGDRLAELLYERWYSLMWEQGTRWIDARRYNLLSTIEPGVPNGQVPQRMPVPQDECSARNLPTTCSPLGT